MTMIKNKLIKLSDKKYREFQIKLLPGVTNMYGVRLGDLRKLSKTISLNELTDESFEELMLQGFIIGNMKNIDKVFKEIDNFLPKINNWSICDSFVASLKITRMHKKEMFNYLSTYISSDKEYIRRFVIVMLLWYYINDDYLKDILTIIECINKDGYYVKMAISWLICELFYYNNDIGKKILSKINDDFIKSKTISKIKESNKKYKTNLNLERIR